jgi:hypothetical protein
LSLKHDTTTLKASSIPRLIWRSSAAKPIYRNDLRQTVRFDRINELARCVAGIQQECRFKPSQIGP